MAIFNLSQRAAITQRGAAGPAASSRSMHTCAYMHGMAACMTSSPPRTCTCTSVCPAAPLPRRQLQRRAPQRPGGRPDSQHGWQAVRGQARVRIRTHGWVVAARSCMAAQSMRGGGGRGRARMRGSSCAFCARFVHVSCAFRAHLVCVSCASRGVSCASYMRLVCVSCAPQLSMSHAYSSLPACRLHCASLPACLQHAGLASAARCVCFDLT